MAPSFLSMNGNKRVDHARSPAQGGDRDRQAPGRRRRRGVGELPGRGDGPARARLRGAVRDQSAAHLLRRLRLRPHRAGEDHRGLRRQAAGDVRDHVHHRRAGLGPHPRGLRALRHHRRHHRGARGGERALPADAHRARPARGRGDARRGAGLHRGAGVRVHGGRRRAEADRQRLGEPQADREPLPAAAAATSCWPSSPRSSSSA